MKRRVGRVIEEEELVHQNLPKEESQEVGETGRSTKEIHPFSNRKIMPRGSTRTHPDKKKSIKPAEKKPTHLQLDRVVACKGVKMSRPGEEEIEFELNSKKRVNIPLKKLLKQENDVLKKIFLNLNII